MCLKPFFKFGEGILLQDPFILHSKTKEPSICRIEKLAFFLSFIYSSFLFPFFSPLSFFVYFFSRHPKPNVAMVIVVFFFCRTEARLVLFLCFVISIAPTKCKHKCPMRKRNISVYTGEEETVTFFTALIKKVVHRRTKQNFTPHLSLVSN
jgi:hypothetical protein